MELKQGCSCLSLSPSWAKNAFLARILQDSSKNILFARILRDDAILVRFLEVDAFLARPFQAKLFSQDCFREYASCKILARILHDNCFMPKHCKKTIFCKNLTRICKNNAFSCNIFQKRCHKNLARNVIFLNLGSKHCILNCESDILVLSRL